MSTGYKTLSPQRTGDAQTDRALDHIKATINPVLQQLPQGISSLSTATGVLSSSGAPTVTGSKAGNAALASLISALVSLGYIKDGTS